MLNLDSISFSADTSQLDLAAKKIESLGTALSALSVDLNKLDKASSTAAKSQQTIAKAAEDAAKAEEQLSKAKTSTVSSTDAATRAVEKQTLAMKIFRGEAVDLNDQVLTLGSSFTKGQSGQLANLKLLGATNDQLKVLAGSFEDFNKITSANTFDNSAAGLGKLSKEIFELKKVNDLMQRGVALTRDEIVNLVRDSERLTQQFKSEGLSAQQTVQALGGLEAQTIKLAKEKNELIARTRASELAAKSEASVLEKAAIDSAKANDFLAREMSRVDNVLDGFNNNLNITSSNRLLKFREQLKLSGTDAITAEKMLKTYEERLKTINATGATNSKNKREDELKYLARATSVQLGDIGISLAGGQNPLLVLIQQGDQLRGVLNQVGASGNEMQKALSMAFGQIVTGSKDVVMALGSFVVGAFADSGRAVAKFGSDILGVSGAIERLKSAKFAEWAAEGEAGFSKISKAMKASELAVSALGTGIGVFVALAAASTIALYQVTNANDDLSRSLIATGAQFGFTTEYAQGLATVLSGMGATRVDILNTFSEISKSGKISAESFLQVAEAALAIERVGGPAIKDTVSLMGELKEKSVETLTKYAEQTGLITTAQIAYVAQLVESGREISATTEATNILSAAIKDQAKITYDSLSSMGKLWIDIKSGINNTWGALQEFAVSGDTILKPLMFTFDTLLLILTNVAFVLTSLIRVPVAIATTMLSAASAMKDFATGTLSAREALNSVKSSVMGIYDTEKDRVATYKDLTDKINQEGKYSKENAKIAAEAAAVLRKNNSEAAAGAKALADVNKQIKDDYERHDKKTLTRQQFINKAIEDKNKLLREGTALSKEQLAMVEKTAALEWDKANKPKKVPKSDATKGAEDLANWYMRSIERIDDLKNKTIGTIQQLTKAQVLLKDLEDDDQFRRASEPQQEYIRGKIIEIDLLEKQIDAQKELTKAEKEVSKIREDNTKFLAKEKEDRTKILQDSEMKLALLGKTADEQLVITEQHELQNKLLAASLRFEAQRLKLKSDYAKLENKDEFNTHTMEYELDRINQQWAVTRDDLMQASANKFQIAYSEKILNVGKTLSDAITTALFEGGQAGTKKLKDYIVGIFRDKINVSINAVVNTVLGGMFGGSKGSAGGGSGGQSSGLSSIFGSSGSSGGNIFGNFGGKASDWISDIGGSLINSGSESLGELGATLVSNSTAIGQFASYAGDALGYLNAIDKWSKGQRGAAVGSAIGTYFGGPVGAAIGDALGGMLDYKVEDKGGGITATIGGTSGLPSGSVGRYKEFEQKGGLFGGGTTTNREWSVADQGIATYITKNVQAITEVNKAYGKSIGLTSDTITNFTKSIEVNTTGMDAAAAQAAIDAELVKFSSEQIAATYGASIKDVAREGETTADTLKRLGTDLTGVNSMFGTLGYTLYDVSVTGAAAASTLANAFGGLAAAQQQLNGYYENFYSQTEQEANIYNAVKTDLANAGMNFTVDQLRAATKGDIRSAVDSLAGDVGTEQGANRYAAAVKAANKLAGLKTTETKTPEGPTGPLPGTAEYYKPGGDVSSGAASAGDKAADSIANAWQSITDSIWGEVKRIRGLLQESSGNALEIAQQQFNEATAAARSGNQEAAKALPELSKVLLTISQGQASTLIELRRAQALTANSLEQTVTGLASTYGLTVPAFAGGGSYAGGMALVGEQGPELINFNQGGYVHTAGQTASMLGGSGELVSEIRRLNSKVEQLEAAAVSTAISNSKIYKILERVTPNGTTVEVSGTVTAI